MKIGVNTTLRLWDKQKGRCYYCNHTMDTYGTDRLPTVDHIFPKSKGGTLESKDNVALACRYCNLRKGNIDVELFLSGYIGTDEYMVKARGPKRWYHGNLIKW